MALTEIGNHHVLEALDKALAQLGESSKQATIYHLLKTCCANSKEELTRPQIEEGLFDIFGEGAWLILRRFHVELAR